MWYSGFEEGSLFWNFIPLALGALTLVGYWYVFEKTHENGWKGIIPIYNLVILLQIVKKPWWWIFLLLIPILNIFFVAVVFFRLAKAFNKSVWFGLGLFFFPFIFLPILGFDESLYVPENISNDRG